MSEGESDHTTDDDLNPNADDKVQALARANRIEYLREDLSTNGRVIKMEQMGEGLRCRVKIGK